MNEDTTSPFNYDIDFTIHVTAHHGGDDGLYEMNGHEHQKSVPHGDLMIVANIFDETPHPIIDIIGLQ